MSNPAFAKMIFVNLPVRDLPASIAFYEAVGAVRNDDFADDSSQMISFSDTIHAMLLTHERFSGFTSRPISNAQDSVQMGLALSEISREAVDDVVDRALAAGGTEPNPPQDHGFMYGRGFADLDGHMWDSFWMDTQAAVAANKGEHTAA
ncbi:VOC family protein [Sphingobium sp. HWE2-09]|uniref:VOC family protein n=1 Tax=Sphingobium sp. HWE2-09 TaxID=3108390 RepID=UPI002DC3AED4|nr:VOC family protein [Sphingobium sp. HWE2-09]